MDIGTQIAVEAVFNIESMLETPYSSKGQLNVTDYDIWYVNIHTLIRNIINELPDKEEVISKSTGKVEVFDILKVNIFNLSEQCSEYGLKVMFYAPDYSKVLKNGIQLNVGKKAEGLVKVLSYGEYAHERFMKEDITGNVLKDRSLILPKGKILITTHYAVDLLNYKYNSVFHLLETHTGRLVLPKQFNKKYVKNSSVTPEMFPFLEELVYLLGDGNMFKPISIKPRRYLQTIATEQKWTTSTTFSRMRTGLIKDDEIKMIILPMKRLFN